jgi:hypothetical protein
MECVTFSPLLNPKILPPRDRAFAWHDLHIYAQSPNAVIRFFARQGLAAWNDRKLQKNRLVMDESSDADDWNLNDARRTTFSEMRRDFLTGGDFTLDSYVGICYAGNWLLGTVLRAK